MRNLDRRLEAIEEAIPAEKEYTHIPNEAYEGNPKTLVVNGLRNVNSIT